MIQPMSSSSSCSTTTSSANHSSQSAGLTRPPSLLSQSGLPPPSSSASASSSSSSCNLNLDRCSAPSSCSPPLATTPPADVLLPSAATAALARHSSNPSSSGHSPPSSFNSSSSELAFVDWSSAHSTPTLLESTRLCHRPANQHQQPTLHTPHPVSTSVSSLLHFDLTTPASAAAPPTTTTGPSTHLPTSTQLDPISDTLRPVSIASSVPGSISQSSWSDRTINATSAGDHASQASPIPPGPAEQFQPRPHFADQQPAGPHHVLLHNQAAGGFPPSHLVLPDLNSYMGSSHSPPTLLNLPLYSQHHHQHQHLSHPQLNLRVHQTLPSPIDSGYNPFIHHPHLAHNPVPHHVLNWHSSPDGGYVSPNYDPFQIKHRRRTTPAQLGILESQFETNCKPDVVLRKQLAEQLDMTPREVQVWFQNRRAKTKKLEKRAEQDTSKGPAELEPTSNLCLQSNTPPSSVYLSPPSARTSTLPSTNESPEELRGGCASPAALMTPTPSTVANISSNASTATNESADEADKDHPHQQQKLESEKRCRSHSLHHHPYFVPPGGGSSLYPGQTSALSSFFATRSLALSSHPGGQYHMPESPSTGGSIVGARRDSRTSIASSSATTTESSVARTPTTTEFGNEDGSKMIHDSLTGVGGEQAAIYPDGYDPRRRSSCPAEFIQSFDHFGFANGGEQMSRMSTINDMEPLLGTHTTTAIDANDKLVRTSIPTETMNWLGEAAPHETTEQLMSNPDWNILEWKLGGVGEGQETTKTEASAIQRRHSVANMVTDQPSQSGRTGYHMMKSLNHVPRSFQHPIVDIGYARRASTSVLLNSIEEHPTTNIWNH